MKKLSVKKMKQINGGSDIGGALGRWAGRFKQCIAGAADHPEAHGGTQVTFNCIEGATNGHTKSY
jgi:bacteriocin-like protein